MPDRRAQCAAGGDAKEQIFRDVVKNERSDEGEWKMADGFKADKEFLSGSGLMIFIHQINILLYV